MPERPDDTSPDLLQLLNEMDELQEEQRTLDLRDDGAVERCQRKIEALREKIKQLDARRGGPTSRARVGGIA